MARRPWLELGHPGACPERRGDGSPCPRASSACFPGLWGRRRQRGCGSCAVNSAAPGAALTSGQGAAVCRPWLQQSCPAGLLSPQSSDRGTCLLTASRTAASYVLRPQVHQLPVLTPSPCLPAPLCQPGAAVPVLRPSLVCVCFGPTTIKPLAAPSLHTGLAVAAAGRAPGLFCSRQLRWHSAARRPGQLLIPPSSSPFC